MSDFDNPHGVSRTETGREVAPATAGITGDFEGSANYIVPHYHETGHKTRQGMALNTQASQRMERIMARYGEKMTVTPAIDVRITPTSKLPKKKSKVKGVFILPKRDESNIPAPSYANVSDPPSLSPTLSAKPKMVAFHSKEGIIKVVVDAILETDIGLALVFADENEVRFTPAQGNELKLTLPDKKSITVMYLGIIFNWYNSSQQVMTFIKSEA